jgi:chromosome segregation ATPase
MVRRIELVLTVVGGLALLLVLREFFPSWQVSRELKAQNERLETLKGDLEQNARASARHEGELAAHAKKLAEHDAAIARAAEEAERVRAEVARLGETTGRDLGEVRELYKKAQRDNESLTEEVLDLKRARREIEGRLDALERKLGAPQVSPKEVQ